MSKLIRKISFLPLLFIGIPSLLQAQITVRDAAEISYKSELLVGEFADLLNIISNRGTDLKETKDIIYNSHSGEENRIFSNAHVLIESDINPAVHSTSSAHEVTIDQYLTDLDLLYNKSDTPSIRMDDIRVSNIKKADYLYVKVYYHSLFCNKPQKADNSYISNNRVAEIKVDKDKDKWAVHIVHIGFFVPADTLNHAHDSSDVDLISESTASGIINGFLAKSSAAKQADFMEELKARERAKQIEEYKKQQESYNKLLERGDRALAANDYTTALNAFADAATINPYEIYPKSKIRQIRQLAEQVKLSSDELYAQNVTKAQIAEKARKYEEAKEFYTQALAEKPQGSAAIEQSIRVLTVKIRLLTEPAEKYDAGLYKEAIKDYDQAIRKYKNNSDFYLGRGKCYDALRDDSHALKDYDQAYDLDNNNLSAIRLRAELFARKGDNFKALTDYKIYSTIDKTDTVVFLRMSELHILTGNIASALEDLDRVIDIDPRNSSAYYRKGVLLYRENNIKEAYENFTSAIKSVDLNPAAYYQRGLCNIAGHAVTDAGEDFNTARKQGLDPALVQKINDLALAYYRKSGAALNAGLTDSALALVNNAIIINPDQDEFRYRRGECYFVKKDYENAIIQYSDALSINNRNYDALFKRGLSKFHVLSYNDAIIDWEMAGKLRPKEPMTYKLVGDAYYMLNRFSIAGTWYENSLQVSKRDKITLEASVLADLYNNYGKSAFATGDYPHALELFKNAIRNRKLFAEAFYNRGNTYLQLNQLNDAQEDISTAIDLQHDHIQWNYTLGLVLRQRQDFYGAIRQFSTVIKYDSLNELPLAYYKRGECRYRLSDFREALGDYTKSYKHYDEIQTPHFIDELGAIYLQLGKTDSAQIFFDKMLKRDSTDADAWYGMGCAYIQQNHKDNALVCFEKAFRSGSIKYSVIRKDPFVTPVKDDKRFKALVKKYL
ncbi:MAG: tetratricopeptide repeat protein [Bacteroidota bacterium]|nr:tetratricopeptide repeat protein [Bacteroidota bacterium]